MRPALSAWRLGLLVMALCGLVAACAAPPAQATVSAQQIDSFLLAQGSPLAGEGATFWAVGQQYGIDPAFLVAISGAESSFGQYLYSVGSQTASYNAFNWFYAPTRIASTFASWDQAIETVAQGLAGPLYYGAGRYSVASIAPTYCPQGTQNWIANVTAFMVALGGNPNDTRWPQGSQSDPSTPEPFATPPTQAATAGTPRLVIENPITVPRRGAVVGQSLTIAFTLCNTGAAPGSWSGVNLRLVGPSGQTMNYVSTSPFALAIDGTKLFSASARPSAAGPWRAWIDVTTAGGVELTNAQPDLTFAVAGPSGETAITAPPQQ